MTPDSISNEVQSSREAAPNAQLTDYIAQALATQMTKEQIHAELIGAGWQEDDISAALAQRDMLFSGLLPSSSQPPRAKSEVSFQSIGQDALHEETTEHRPEVLSQPQSGNRHTQRYISQKLLKSIWVMLSVVYAIIWGILAIQGYVLYTLKNVEGSQMLIFALVAAYSMQYPFLTSVWTLLIACTLGITLLVRLSHASVMQWKLLSTWKRIVRIIVCLLLIASLIWLYIFYDLKGATVDGVKQIENSAKEATITFADIDKEIEDIRSTLDFAAFYPDPTLKYPELGNIKKISGLYGGSEAQNMRLTLTIGFGDPLFDTILIQEYFWEEFATKENISATYTKYFTCNREDQTSIDLFGEAVQMCDERSDFGPSYRKLNIVRDGVFLHVEQAYKVGNKATLQQVLLGMKKMTGGKKYIENEKRFGKRILLPAGTVSNIPARVMFPWDTIRLSEITEHPLIYSVYIDNNRSPVMVMQGDDKTEDQETTLKDLCHEGTSDPSSIWKDDVISSYMLCTLFTRDEGSYKNLVANIDGKNVRIIGGSSHTPNVLAAIADSLQ